MNIAKLFDFDQPNLQDIEITNTLNQYIELSVGHKISPLTRLRVSNLYLTLEQFEKVLPLSALPAFIRAGGVKLKPIFSSLSIRDLATVTKNPVAVVEDKVVDVNNIKEVVKEDTKTPGTLKEGENPFGYETNEKEKSLTASSSDSQKQNQQKKR